MTKQEIEREIARVIEELDEVRCELIEIDAEEGDEDELTPQRHIDYLRNCEADLLAEYNELCRKREAA